MRRGRLTMSEYLATAADVMEKHSWSMYKHFFLKLLRIGLLLWNDPPVGGGFDGVKVETALGAKGSGVTYIPAGNAGNG